MKPTIPLRQALNDSALLGKALAGDSWLAWRALLLAMLGETLTDEERALFTQLTGREREPGKPVDEFWGVVGRRGGKSKAIGTLAVYLGGLCDHRDRLVAGERGVVLCIAPDQRQAHVVLDYAEGILQTSPVLAQLIAHRTGDAL